MNRSKSLKLSFKPNPSRWCAGLISLRSNVVVLHGGREPLEQSRKIMMALVVIVWICGIKSWQS
jgi:hypothetical protein